MAKKSQTTPPNTAEESMIFSMKDDLLQNILLRLPMEDVAQCKQVCKQWRKLISRPRFTVQLSGLPTHTMLPEQNFYMIVQVIPRHTGGNFVSFQRDCLQGASIIGESKLIGTCDGLICLSPMDTGAAFVWNPVLQRKWDLPFQRMKNEKGFFFYGFGYDKVVNDYKVVKVTQQSNARTAVEICNLYQTTRWNRPRGIKLPSTRLPFLLTNACPVTANDSPHWIAVSLQNKNLELVRFDMVSETFVEIPFSNDIPNVEYNVETKGMENVAKRSFNSDIDIDGKQYRLGMYEARVCLFVTTSSGLEIWCMDKNLIWSKIIHILAGADRYEQMGTVLGFSANNELVAHHKSGSIYARDPHTLRIVFAMARMVKITQMVTYIESLTPLPLTDEIGSSSSQT